MNTPVGVVWRTGYVRLPKSIFNSSKPYLISEMKRNKHNIEPVVVIDDITKTAKCYLINAELTTFETYNDSLLCRKVESVSQWAIEKYKIQISNKKPQDKEKEVRKLAKNLKID